MNFFSLIAICIFLLGFAAEISQPYPQFEVILTYIVGVMFNVFIITKSPF